MKTKPRKIIQYLLIPLPLIIYLVLTVVCSLQIVLLYFQSYFNAKIIAFIRYGMKDPQWFNVSPDIIDQMKNTMIVLSLIMVPILTGIFFFFWYRLLKKGAIKHEPKMKLFHIKSILLIIVVGLGLQLAISGLMELILPHFQKLTESYNELMKEITIGNPILIFISVVIIAPLSEEVTFRGVILTRAKAVTPFAVANILQALCFGIAHLNIVQGVYAFIGGLILGYVAYKFKTIKASIMLHMLFNGLNFVLMTPASFWFQILYISIGIILIVFALSRIRKSSMKLEASAGTADINYLLGIDYDSMYGGRQD